MEGVSSHFPDQVSPEEKEIIHAHPKLLEAYSELTLASQPYSFIHRWHLSSDGHIGTQINVSYIPVPEWHTAQVPRGTGRNLPLARWPQHRGHCCSRYHGGSPSTFLPVTTVKRMSTIPHRLQQDLGLCIRLRNKFHTLLSFPHLKYSEASWTSGNDCQWSWNYSFNNCSCSRAVVGVFNGTGKHSIRPLTSRHSPAFLSISISKDRNICLCVGGSVAHFCSIVSGRCLFFVLYNNRLKL